jgi:2'-5' RNA ligase
MVTTPPASAVVVRIAVPPALMRLRRAWDRNASAGIPAHVTILFPFVGPGDLGSSIRGELASIAASQERFEVRFERVGRFPGVVYLVPDPAEPFMRLITAVAVRFPAYPPYGGEFAEVIPHLTIAESDDDGPLDEVATIASRNLPFGAHVAGLEVLVESGAGRWHRHWRLPLGTPATVGRGPDPRP